MTPSASKPPHRRRSKPASTTGGANPPGRPLSKMRTIGETAEILNTSSRTVRRLIGARSLTVHRFGRLVRIADADIEALLADNRSI